MQMGGEPAILSPLPASRQTWLLKAGGMPSIPLHWLGGGRFWIVSRWCKWTLICLEVWIGLFI